MYLVRIKAYRLSTHPDFATLVDPLFAFGGKRGKSSFPSLLLAVERDVERSNDRVSKIEARFGANAVNSI
jgi:hypothetical protein